MKTLKLVFYFMDKDPFQMGEYKTYRQLYTVHFTLYLYAHIQLNNAAAGGQLIIALSSWSYEFLVTHSHVISQYSIGFSEGMFKYFFLCTIFLCLQKNNYCS